MTILNYLYQLMLQVTYQRYKLRWVLKSKQLFVYHAIPMRLLCNLYASILRRDCLPVFVTIVMWRHSHGRNSLVADYCDVPNGISVAL